MLESGYSANVGDLLVPEYLHAINRGGVRVGAEGKNCMPVREFLTKNCVLMLRKIPSTRLYSPCRGTWLPIGQTLAKNRIAQTVEVAMQADRSRRCY